MTIIEMATEPKKDPSSRWSRPSAWRVSGGEIGMLVLETVLRIRREHASGKAIKAIARDLHLSRGVVRKAIRSPEADMAYRREVQPLPKLGPFQARLDTLLEDYEARPRREKLRVIPGLDDGDSEGVASGACG